MPKSMPLGVLKIEHLANFQNHLLLQKNHQFNTFEMEKGLQTLY